MVRHSLLIVWTLSVCLVLCKCHALEKRTLCTESTLHSFRDASDCQHHTERMAIKGETFEEEGKKDDATDSIETQKEKVKAAEEKVQSIVKSAEEMQAQVSKAEVEEMKKGNESNAKSVIFLEQPLGSAKYAKEVQSAMQTMNTKLNKAEERVKAAIEFANEANKKMNEAKSTLDAAEKESDNNQKKEKAAKAAKDAEEAQTEAEKANTQINEANNTLTELKNEYKKLEIAFCKVTISHAANVVFHLHRNIQDNFFGAFINNSRMIGALRDIQTILNDMKNVEMKKTVQTQLESAKKFQSEATILYKKINDTYTKAKEGKEKTTKFWNNITQYTSLEEVKNDCDEAEKILKETEEGKKSAESECIKFSEKWKKVEAANDTAFIHFYANKVLMSIHYAQEYAQEVEEKRQKEESDFKVIEALNKGEMGEYGDMMRHEFDLFQKLFSQFKQNADKTSSAKSNAENQKEKAMKAVNDVSTTKDAAVMERHANDAKDASIAASLHEREASTHHRKVMNEYFDLFKTKNVIKITSSAIKATNTLNKTKEYVDQITEMKAKANTDYNRIKEMSGKAQTEHQMEINAQLKSAEDAFATITQQNVNAQDAFYKIRAEKNKIDDFVRGMQKYGTCPQTSSNLFNKTQIALSEIEEEENKSKEAFEKVMTAKSKIENAMKQAEKSMDMTNPIPKKTDVVVKKETSTLSDKKKTNNLSDKAVIPSNITEPKQEIKTPNLEDTKKEGGKEGNKTDYNKNENHSKEELNDKSEATSISTNSVDTEEKTEKNKEWKIAHIEKNSDLVKNPYHTLLFSFMVLFGTILLYEAQ